ncbi:MAG: biotin/lipoyl-containing protein [Pseudomonas sp.]|uniref:acetyl-CoA carboxylase biotin carboxyl carrier protein subunit n=1 Tax=Pseudomonas sp. TaxID=306 RepID=UPI003D109438
MSRSAAHSAPVTTLAGSVEGDAGTQQVHIEPLDERCYRALFADGRSLLLEVLQQEELPRRSTRLELSVDGQRQTVHVTPSGAGQLTLNHAGSQRTLTWHNGRRRGAGEAAPRQAFSATLLAPMPARVLEVLVAEGDQVEENQPLLRIEAMKMVMTLSAPGKRQIKTLHINQDDGILAGQLLISFNEAP